MKLKLWKLKMRLKGIHIVDIAPKSLLIYKLKVKGNAQKVILKLLKGLIDVGFQVHMLENQIESK